MKSVIFDGKKRNPPRKQRGVVLLLTLIILVAMTLAGVGMMRSVDTGNIIAGNLAFRQATANAGDAGPSAGFNALMLVANSNNTADKNILNFSHGQPCPSGATATLCPGGNINLPGYASTPMFACEVTRTCLDVANYTWWTVDNNWTNAPSTPVTDPNGGEIATVSYLVHRMCQSPGVGPNVSGQLCQTFTAPADGCSKTQLAPCISTSVFYRITTRSQGTRDTVTYAQTLVLIAE
jgi:type IV pilus assembly protein PilX